MILRCGIFEFTFLGAEIRNLREASWLIYYIYIYTIIREDWGQCTGTASMFNQDI